jgi:hypothetical protein
VDHRVEPPAWLPQGAAPEAADPETDESPAAEAAQAAEDSTVAPAEAAPEEFTNGHGHDGTYSYSGADPYRYSEDNAFAEGTTYRSPFTPKRSDGSGYAHGDEAMPDEEEASYAAPASAPDDSDGLHETSSPDPGLPASGLSTSTLPSSDLLGSDLSGSDLPGSDLPATGLVDPGMPEAGFPGAAAGYTGTRYTDPGYSDTAAPYTTPAEVPYPAAAPRGSAATAAETGTGFGATDTTAAADRDAADRDAADRGARFGAAAAAAGGIGAALRSGKQRGAVRLTRGSPTARARPASSGQPRRANLVIARIEPWSVMKFSFLISLVLWLVMFVAVALLYYALSSLGVFAALQRTFASVTASQGSAGVDLTKWTSATRVLGYTMLLGAVDVVLITAISTVGAVIYNLVTHLGGGIEVTLKETE